MTFRQISGLVEVELAKFPRHLPYRRFDYDLLPSELTKVAKDLLVQPICRGHQSIQLCQWVLLALKGTSRKLSSIKMMNLDLRTLDDFDDALSPVMETLESLRQITIRIPFVLGDRIGGIQITPGWGRARKSKIAKLVGAATTLDKLDVSYDYCPDDVACFHDENRLADILQFRSSWPHLTTINLKGFFTDGATLVNFLESHSSTLRSLELTNISILVLTDEPKIPPGSVTASWVSIIRFLENSLHLKHIILNGYFSYCEDGLRDFWYSSTDYKARLSNTQERDLFVYRPDCLRLRIQRFIVEGGECPLPARRELWEEVGDDSWMRC